MIANVEVDLAELSRAVGHEVSEYTAEPIDPELRRHSVTGGVFRVRTGGGSLVIKVVTHGSDPDPGALWVAGAEPTHRNYWKREWEAYCSGLLDALPGELRSPRTMLCTAPSDDECWIWMEDVAGTPGADWPVADYDSIAFDLATTQAAYAGGRSVLPGYPWLSRHWLRGWVDTLARDIGALDDEALWRADEQAAMAALRPRIRAVWEAREGLLGLVESAPQTVVHNDFWPTNLIAADDGTTVAVDWSQVGVGSVGQDLDQLTLDPVWMQVLPDVGLDELEAHVLPSYLSGLRLSGCDIEATELHRWYAAAAGIRYAPMAAYHARTAADPEQVRSLEARFAMPFAAIAANKARVVGRAVELAEAALDGR
jgi:hypothetical protein